MQNEQNQEIEVELTDNEKLALMVARDIDEYSYEYDDGYRNHLGASQIGSACRRQTWYGFRWAGPSDFKGDTRAEKHAEGARMHRLWQRGHLEEFRFIEYLVGMDWKVFDKDTSKLKSDGVTHPQFRILGHKGHFGGSMDGVGIAPPRYGLGNQPILLEFKTASHKVFLQVKKHGVRKSKPQHYSQMCLYGDGYDITKGLYICVDKDTDKIYVEFVDLDPNNAIAMHATAETLIEMRSPPDKSFAKNNFNCKMCDFRKICHENKSAEPSCRSCKFSLPIEHGKWFCEKHNNEIPKEHMPIGCNKWEDITNV
jgi:CRISPR/Cas system-associated exonuclease Cas4 (RecB family)